MFIKFEIYDGTSNLKTRTYDAVVYSYESLSIEEDQSMEHCRFIIDVGEQDERTFIVHCPSTKVFIMNDNGVTVDKISWPPVKG